jgi:hypothetical protein
MKKWLAGLGVTFLILIAALGIAMAILAYRGRHLDAESQQYVDQAVTAIAAEWKLSEFLQRASPEFLAKVNGPDIDRVFATLQVKLGKLKQYKGAKGAARLSWHAGGERIVAQYVATAEFEGGPAEITVNLIKLGNGWQLLGFYVNSRLLL